VTGPDLAEPALVVERIRDARRRVRSVAPGRRTWTLETPVDWPVELPLHDRLQQQRSGSAGSGRLRLTGPG
jgi:hypothetical protein